jgi:hypothetical protein
MITSWRGTLTIEPLANAMDQLTLEMTQALVLWSDNQDVLLAPALALCGFYVHGRGLHAP